MSSPSSRLLLRALVSAGLLLPRAALAGDAASSWSDAAPSPSPSPSPSPAASAPLVEVLFPNADPPSTPSPAVGKDAPSPPPPPIEKKRMPLRLGAGAGVLGSGLGTTPTGVLLVDIPTSNPRLAARLWGDVPLGSKDVASDGGVSSYSVWTAGGGIVGALTEPTNRLVLRIHGGWGGTILHVAGVSVDPRSGLKLGARPSDLFTLFGQTGLELSFRVHPMLAIVGGGRAGLTISKLVVHHQGPSGSSAGSWGVPFGGADLRLEVSL